MTSHSKASRRYLPGLTTVLTAASLLLMPVPATGPAVALAQETDGDTRILEDVIATIEGMDLTHGISRSMIAKLDAAIGYIADDAIDDAIDAVLALTRQAVALIGTQLDENQAGDVIRGVDVFLLRGG